MAVTFFFYDLETSGFSASNDRIMQFAGQRTNEQLEPIGEPVNVLVKLAGDILPSPDAIMITGITPQATIAEGLTEAEFLDYFYKEVVQPNTVFLGFNTVRFDDEFMRYLHYRNFYDPYEWQWANGCSRWDILDLVRMTRALRPEGIEWPVDDNGKATNRLEMLTKANGLDHEHAHDALNDVIATIAIAKLVKTKQPELFDYAMQHRSKRDVGAIVTAGQPFVYTSGRYPSDGLHTTVAIMLAKHEKQDSALVYDLRHDPTPFFDMTPEQLVEAWRYKKDRPAEDLRLPVKTIKYNRCPAIAPLGVIKDTATQHRLNLSLNVINENLQKLKAGHQAFAETIADAVILMDRDREQSNVISTSHVDERLYDGFLGDDDRQLVRAIRAAAPEDIISVASKAQDGRLRQLAPLYKARNYPAQLTSEERQAWEAHVTERLFNGGPNSRLSVFFGRLQELSADTLTSHQEYLLEELQLYGESIMPSDITEDEAVA